MKVVLFCGGFGMRMRVGDDPTPKPMMTVGHRPVLWHIMRYYAHFGHTEFILCLGYGAEKVKEYFLNYQETASNDFVLSNGGRRVDMISTDISDWKITFVDTGLHSEIGERLRRVRPHLNGDDVFLATYGDVLTDAPLNDLIEEFHTRDAAASLLAVPPPGSFHVVHVDDAGDRVVGFEPAKDLNFRINGGFFILRQEIFDYLEEGEDLVGDACRKAAKAGRMISLPYDGFWAPMDTLKERAHLEDLYFTGASPWTLWRDEHVVPAGAASSSRRERLVVAPMISLDLPGGPLSVLCLGAHPDDIEIGCGGTLLALAATRRVTATHVILTGTEDRQVEGRHAAQLFWKDTADEPTVVNHSFRDGRLPASWDEVKQALEDVAADVRPHLILAPRTDDSHQDHRLLAELVPTVWRNALVLHYEIPKWEGDLAAVTHYVPLTREQAVSKARLLDEAYPSQHHHDWWDEETFLGLMRLRGVECRAPYAEGFVSPKTVLGLGQA